VHAGSARSSQALCLSAWYPLKDLEARHEVIERLLTASLPSIAPQTGRRWQISVEETRPELLAKAAGDSRAASTSFCRPTTQSCAWSQST